MRLFIPFFLFMFICFDAFGYTKDPTTRTHDNNTDICWNIRDIIDDYVNFDYLNRNPNIRQQMYDELSLYINTIRNLNFDPLPESYITPNVELEVSDQARNNEKAT